MLTAVSKSRPALVSARSSFNASSGSGRSASTFAASDIFDAPGRMIFDDETTGNSSPSTARQYQPSHFRPRPSQTSAHISSAPVGPSVQQHQSPQQSQPHTYAAHARQMSTFSHQRTSDDGSSILFDGPARPRHPPRVTSRHEHARASSSAASLPIPPGPLNAFEGVDMEKYVPPAPRPEPLLFDGPARPRRRAPVQLKKASQNGTNAQSPAVVGALAGLLGLGGAYEIYEAQQSSQSTPDNILSFSRSRESLASRELEEEPEEPEEAEPTHEVLRNEVLPNIY